MWICAEAESEIRHAAAGHGQRVEELGKALRTGISAATGIRVTTTVSEPIEASA